MFLLFERNPVITPNREKYHEENLKLARDYVKKFYFEIKDLLKGVILFGSTNKNTLSSESDIDLMIIIDDISIKMTPKMQEGIRLISQKLVLQVSEKLHIHLLFLSKFWEYARIGDPVLINVLRTGVALIDTGFITPMQRLVEVGAVKPTSEAVINYLQTSAHMLITADQRLMQSVLDLYWSAIDAVHAYFMALNRTPKTPEKMGAEMETDPFFTKDNIKLIRTLYKLSKDIIRSKRHIITSKIYEDLRDRTIKFHNKVRKNLEEY